jgi:hypothetical protein
VFCWNLIFKIRLKSTVTEPKVSNAPNNKTIVTKLHSCSFSKNLCTDSVTGLHARVATDRIVVRVSVFMDWTHDKKAMGLLKSAVRIRTMLTNVYTLCNRTRLMFQRVSAFYLRICLFLEWVDTIYTRIMYTFVKRVFAFYECTRLIAKCFNMLYSMIKFIIVAIIVLYVRTKLVWSCICTWYERASAMFTVVSTQYTMLRRTLKKVCFFCTKVRLILQSTVRFHAKAKLVVSNVLAVYKKVKFTLKHLLVLTIPVFFVFEHIVKLYESTSSVFQEVSQYCTNMIIIEVILFLYLYLSATITTHTVSALFVITNIVLQAYIRLFSRGNVFGSRLKAK